MKQSCIFMICLILAFTTVDTMNIKKMTNLMSDNHTENHMDNYTDYDMKNNTQNHMDNQQEDHMEEIEEALFGNESNAENVIRTACMGADEQGDCAVYMCQNNYMVSESNLCYMINNEFIRQMQRSEESFEEVQEDSKQVFLKTLKTKYDNSYYEDCYPKEEKNSSTASGNINQKQFRECMNNQCTKEEHKDQYECIEMRKLSECKSLLKKTKECKERINQAIKQAAENVLRERCDNSKNYGECTKSECTADESLSKAWSCEHIASEAKIDNVCAQEKEESDKCRNRRQLKEKRAAQDLIQELCYPKHENGGSAIIAMENREVIKQCEQQNCLENPEVQKAWTCEHYAREAKEDAKCMLKENITSKHCEMRALNKLRQHHQDQFDKICNTSITTHDEWTKCAKNMCAEKASDAWSCDNFKQEEKTDNEDFQEEKEDEEDKSDFEDDFEGEDKADFEGEDKADFDGEDKADFEGEDKADFEGDVEPTPDFEGENEADFEGEGADFEGEGNADFEDDFEGQGGDEEEVSMVEHALNDIDNAVHFLRHEHSIQNGQDDSDFNGKTPFVKGQTNHRGSHHGSGH